MNARLDPETISLSAARLWLPVEELRPGMILARPVSGRIGQRLTLWLPVGTLITENTIAQLINKGIECVAVIDDDPPTEEQYVKLLEAAQARLRTIFGDEARMDNACRELFDQLCEVEPCR